MLNSTNIIWKDIKGYEEHYQISSTGLVRSVERKVTNTYKSVRTVEEKIRSPSIRSGYNYIHLYKNDKYKVFAVHRLVALHFIENPDNKSMVNHIDGNRLNNNVYNLEWVTCSENYKHAYKIGLRNKEDTAKRMYGTKFNSKSKYHNVSWDSSRNKWKATLKDKGKMIFQKRFNTEKEAAIYVNKMLDELGYMNRPRNIIT